MYSELFRCIKRRSLMKIVNYLKGDKINQSIYQSVNQSEPMLASVDSRACVEQLVKQVANVSHSMGSGKLDQLCCPATTTTTTKIYFKKNMKHLT